MHMMMVHGDENMMMTHGGLTMLHMMMTHVDDVFCLGSATTAAVQQSL